MDRFVARRSALIASATPGIEAARELSELSDEAVSELSGAASSLHEGRWAIVTLGGWGAGALLPDSDLDLLILSETPAERLRPFVEAVLYLLWDAGLKVGHQVRSPRRQRTAARDDLTTLTASLTGRPLAGDEAWARETLVAVAADARKRSRKVLAEIAGRDRPGSPWLLQPDLKNGAGGRRDFDELTWTAAVLTGTPCHAPDALTGLGLLADGELALLHEAARTVARARFATQRAGFGDRFSSEAADETAGILDADELQAALGDTALILHRIRARLAGTAADETAPLDAAAVFSALDRGPNGFDELAYAAQAGRLDTLVPGFRRLMAAHRPGLGHELTVGAHCLAAAGLLFEPAGDDRVLDASIEAIADRRVVRVAALAHDAGKLDGTGGHAERGAPAAEAAAAAFGLGADAARDAGDLVRRHLLLVETALRDDLDDEDTILRCTAALGRRELLAGLHLLTAADSRATGPATWTPWVARMVGTLVTRVDAAFSAEVDGAGLATRAAEVRREAMAAGDGLPEAAREFLAGAPIRYLASRTPERALSDARLIAGLAAGGAARQAAIAVSPGPVDATHTVTIVGADRPQLLARLAGALALAGLDILSVDAYPAPGGLALDSFTVTSATRRPVTPETFSAVERFVDAALRDRLELATRLAERRRHYPPRSAAPSKVTTKLTGWDTAVSVTTADRPGLLHDIAAAIARDGVDVRWARALTVNGMARDIFHVTGADGGPLDDAGALGHLAMRIREAIQAQAYNPR